MLCNRSSAKVLPVFRFIFRKSKLTCPCRNVSSIGKRQYISRLQIASKLLCDGTPLRSPSNLRLMHMSQLLHADSASGKSLSESETNSNINIKNRKENETYEGKSQELLESLIAVLSTDIHTKKRVYINDFEKVLKNVAANNFVSRQQGVLLLTCCSEYMPDVHPARKIALANRVWKAIEPHTRFTVDHYNELLRCFKAGNMPNFNAQKFIGRMSPLKPNETTYDLMLQVLSEAGDIDQAVELLSNMKALDIPLTSKTFDSLILCNGKNKKFEAIEELRTIMKSLKIEESLDTRLAIIKSYAWNKMEKEMMEEMEKVKEMGFEFQEGHVIELVKYLAEKNMDDAVPKVLRYLPARTLSSPSISAYMQAAATELVFRSQPLIALQLYSCLPLPIFGPKDDTGLYARGLVRDCVKAAVSANTIGEICAQLMSTGRNPIALQNACEAALQLKRVPLALELMDEMRRAGFELRPHYFWPIIVANSHSFGEKGVLETVRRMVSMGVEVDYETMRSYVLPGVTFTSGPMLMRRLVDAGLSVHGALTPVLASLAHMGQLQPATEMCELFKAKLDSERLLSPLVTGFSLTQDAASTAYILEDMTKRAEIPKDWTGMYLCRLARNKRMKAMWKSFTQLLEELSKLNLKVSGQAAAGVLEALAPVPRSAEALPAIARLLETMSDPALDDLFETPGQIQHPRAMDEGGLSAHLAELEGKGLNARGTLRRLLQRHCAAGSLQAARGVLDKLRLDGAKLSAGMKASLFHLYVRSGELDEANATLDDLSKSSFRVDAFKIVDFATALVAAGRVDRAFQVVEQHLQQRELSQVSSMENNCKRLLDALGAHCTPARARDMFRLLVGGGHAQPTNVLLGCLVMAHLRSDDMASAVEEFVRLAGEYNKTPMKEELLCRLFNMAEGKMAAAADGPALAKMAQAVMDADTRVHGAANMQVSVIAALAQCGLEGALRKQMLAPVAAAGGRAPGDALLRRCRRFAELRQAAPLLHVLRAARDAPHRVDAAALCALLLNVYERDGDTAGALKLWEHMQEWDIRPSKSFVSELTSMLRANRATVPPELLTLLDEDTKKKILNAS